MSCVNYWNECPDCGHISYDRSKADTCTKCGSKEVENHVEYDEGEPDYDEPQEKCGPADAELLLRYLAL